MEKYSKKILLYAVILTALGTISLSPYRLALKVDVDAVAASLQADQCVSMQMRLNDAYSRRDDYLRGNLPVPAWLSRQIAELEVYLRTRCA